MSAAIPLLVAAAISESPLSTLAERTGWTQTGRYDEVVRLCSAFAKAHPKKIRCRSFGRTPEGRPMLSLVASADGTFEPESARKKGRPVVLLQAGIHAGEIDGKDAGFWLLRELLENKAAPGALSKVTVVFVPVFNVDGHERFSPYNRPNQDGPREMGWRVTSQNLNLNRDYTKADAPEMVAMLNLMDAWDPILLADLHVTNGAKFEPDVAVLFEPILWGAEPLREQARNARDALFQKLEGQGHLPLSFYAAFLSDDDPSSGFAMAVLPPRFSTAYWPTRNRLAVLVETHSWKDYATRVRATYDVAEGLIELAARDGAAWLKAARSADEADRTGGSREVPLAFQPSGKSVPLKFRGFAYRRESSDVSGGLWTRYDVGKPQIWQVPLLNELKPVLTATLPKGGYLVSAAAASWVGEKLRLHGLSFQVLKSAHPGLEVESFRATEVKFKPETYEGRVLPQVKGSWRPERRDLPAGSLFVPAAQRGMLLVAHLLEPASPDSFLSWGFFNAFFEQKEAMDSFVAEELAREMLKKDPKLKAEFEKKLADDPEFVRDSSARLRFFYRRSPYWDERYGLYPVYRSESAVE
jgi:hypothetical protein